MSSIKSYSEKYTKTIKLRNGAEAFLRPIKDTDDQMLYDLFSSCSYETIYFRFMTSAIFHHIRTGKTEFIMNMIRRLTNIDYDNQMAIIALINKNNKEKIVSEGRYAKTGADRAEVAVITTDNWQRQGLATNIGEFLIEIAKSKGIKIFEGEISLSNHKLLKLFKDLKIKYTRVIRYGSLHFEINLDDPFLK